MTSSWCFLSMHCLSRHSEVLPTPAPRFSRNGEICSTASIEGRSSSTNASAKPRSTRARGPMCRSASCFVRPNKSMGLTSLRSLSTRVMENQADGMALATADATDTVMHGDLACAASLSRHRALIHGECDCIALAQRDHVRALMAGVAFGHHKFAAREVLAGT